MRIDAKGFSLTELVVILAIMGTLLSIVSLNFSSWQKKYYIEDQAKEMMADLNDLRMRAIQTKRNHVAVLSVNSMQMAFRSYSSEEPVTLTTGQVLYTKNLKYSIITLKSDGSLVSCKDIGINTRGYTNDFLPVMSGGTFQSDQTIIIQPTGTGAAVDCLVISDARINLGKYDGTNCTFK